MQEIRWGIIGCGRIAHMFASSLKATGRGVLLAGASRTLGRAEAFAKKNGVERVYSDYESLAADPDVDAVYVATTHNFHFENVRLCLEHGKHVLCEKPFTISASQTLELMELAREKKCFLMEAVWTRFLPAIGKLRELLDAGAIGEVTTVKADFSIPGDFSVESRLRNKALSGGALLDLGIYSITFASIVFGAHPTRIQSSFVPDAETGVDERSFYLFDYEGGRRALLSSSFSDRIPTEGVVCGTRGYIRVPHFLGAQELQLFHAGEAPETLQLPYGEGENFKFEIAHVMDCIAAGKTESDILPLRETLATMRIMDTLRSQWGLKYEGE